VLREEDDEIELECDAFCLVCKAVAAALRGAIALTTAATQYIMAQ
jgi:hypothetical protein